PSPKDVVRSVATRSEPNTILDLSGAEAVTTAAAAERRGRRGIVGALVALAIAGAILASMWLAHPFRAATSHGGPAPGQSAGPSPSGSTPPPSPGPATPFTSTFPESAKGGGLAMQVARLPSRDADCATHLFAGAAAYQSECRSWRRLSDAEWFWISYRNARSSPVSFAIDRFELRGPPGRVARPIDVRRIAS